MGSFFKSGRLITRVRCRFPRRGIDGVQVDNVGMEIDVELQGICANTRDL